MSVLSELSSATGEKSSNDELVRRCLLTPAFTHSISEGLRTASGPAQEDCMYILLEVAKRRPELLGPFASDFFEATRGGNRKLAKQGFSGLTLLVHTAASEIFGERESLLATARQGGPLGQAAAGVLAELCASSANYRGKLLVHVVRLLRDVPAKDLGRWVTVLAPAVAGSADGIKRLEREVDGRRPELTSDALAKLDKALAKMGRGGKKR